MSKHENRQLWFKRKRYGYGWVPASWRGWLAIIVYILIVLGGAITLKDVPDNTFTKEVGFYLTFVAIATAALVRLSYKYGPKPKWRWGKKADDDPRQDW